jgi:hypothetical protein
MRKLPALLGIVLALSVVVAPAAAAQEGVRDPFLPLIAPPGQEDGTVAQPGDPTDPTVSVEPAPTEPLPTTGSSPAPWLAIAYVLVAFGTGAIVLSRVLGPPPASAR